MECGRDAVHACHNHAEVHERRTHRLPPGARLHGPPVSRHDHRLGALDGHPHPGIDARSEARPDAVAQVQRHCLAQERVAHGRRGRVERVRHAAIVDRDRDRPVDRQVHGLDCPQVPLAARGEAGRHGISLQRRERRVQRDDRAVEQHFVPGGDGHARGGKQLPHRGAAGEDLDQPAVAADQAGPRPFDRNAQPARHRRRRRRRKRVLGAQFQPEVAQQAAHVGAGGADGLGLPVHNHRDRRAGERRPPDHPCGGGHDGHESPAPRQDGERRLPPAAPATVVPHAARSV